jgi:hypothetical protein
MAQKPENTKRKVTGVQKGLGVTADGKYGPKTRAALMDEFKQPMGEAVKFAENNKRNHGVLSVKTNNPSQVLDDSVRNNLNRFMTGRQSNDNYDNSGTPRFVDFMQQRWAPIGAKNDPKNLNQNWAPNVRGYLKKQYPDKYQRWRNMNLVQSPINQFQAVA